MLSDLWLAIVSAAVASIVCCLVVRFRKWHSWFSADLTDSGPHKFHARSTPRIGGLAIAGAMIVTIAMSILMSLPNRADSATLSAIAYAAILPFVGGIAEDVTKRVGVLPRLLLTISGGALAAWLAGASLDRVDVPGLDMLLALPWFAFLFTSLAVGGVANAVNIIDGYNGLVSGYAVVVFSAFAAVALQVGDPLVFSGSLMMIGALLGFLAWNYPHGRIFLGDGGAYVLGFWLAELSVLLVVRNPAVSPWFPLVMLAYPVFDTLFAIYRKAMLRGESPGQPDGIHLQMLIYKRLVRVFMFSHDPDERTARNSLVARYVWIAALLSAIPAVACWDRTGVLVSEAVILCAGYAWIYRRIVSWRTPHWLIIRDSMPGRAPR